MGELSVLVAEVRPETADAATFRLDLRDAPFPHRPGQYIEIDPHQFPELARSIAEIEAIKGMPESPRGFSLASDGLEPRFLEITVKAEKPRGPHPPLLTPWMLRDLRPGRTVAIAGPAGRYCLPEAPPSASGFLHLCAGSGVAPNRGMIRSALLRGWPQRHLLVLQNRTEADIFYRSEWPDLLQRFPGRLKIRHVLSATDGEHVSADLVRAEMTGFIDPADALALVCGPNRPREVQEPGGAKRRVAGFCELWCGNPRRNVPGFLGALGFPPDRILTEMW
jgi:ferredoxin-NADP reductase